MRITLHSATELQLEDSGRGLVAFGGLSIAAALLGAGFAYRDGKTFAVLIALVAFGGAGVVMLRRARAAVHHFDLRRRTLTIETRPVFTSDRAAREVTTFPLDTLSDVTLEESSPDAGSRHSHTFRPVYVFRDGRRVPLVPYYTSGKTAKAALQATIRDFLSRARS
jgi:hypothetical protein